MKWIITGILLCRVAAAFAADSASSLADSLERAYIATADADRAVEAGDWGEAAGHYSKAANHYRTLIKEHEGSDRKIYQQRFLYCQEQLRHIATRTGTPVDELIRQHHDRKQAISYKEMYFNALREQSAAAGQHREEIKRLRGSIAQQQRQLADLEASAKKRNEELQRAAQQNNTLKGEMVTLTQQLNRAFMELSILQSKEVSTTDELLDKDPETVPAETKNRRLQKLERENRRLRESVKRLTSESKALREALQRAGRELVKLRQQREQ